ncbi:MAG: phosphotransferase, partial [Planctomycetota bacterium]
MSDRIEELLAEFWSRRDAGERLTPAMFLREHAGHAEALRPALEELLGAAAMLPTDDLPTSIGGYLVEGLLGRGAAGEVFAVVDDAGRPFALKRLLPHIAAVVRAQQRLQREAAVLRDLDHANIVEVKDIGEDGGLPFVVMERIDGVPLSA